MFTIDQIHNFIFFLSRKNQNFFFSHEEVDMALDFAQMAKFDKITGRPEANTGYLPPNKSGVRQDQWFNDALNPFRIVTSFLNTDNPNGLLTLPANYLRLTALYITTFDNDTQKIKTKGIQILGDDLLPDAITNPISPPSTGKPIASWLYSGNQYQIQFYPKQSFAGTYTYLSRPPAPFYNYTGTRPIVFNPIGSVNLLWNDSLQASIVMDAMQFLGMNISDNTIIQLSKISQKEGVIS